MVHRGHLISLTDLIGKINIMTKKNIDDFLEKKVEDGKTVSPILPENVKNYLIDIDGTICDDIPNEEPELMASAKLYPDALKTLNKWYDEGHIITFFTSRLEEHRQVTEEWLEKNGFKIKSFLNTGDNLKITTKDDLEIFKKLLKKHV